MARESIQFNLVEALRRFEMQEHRPNALTWTVENLVKYKWTGLAYASNMKQTTAKGYMRCACKYPPRTLGWYLLTEKGAKIVLEWHNQGFGFDEDWYGYNAKGQPTFYTEIEKALQNV